MYSARSWVLFLPLLASAACRNTSPGAPDSDASAIPLEAEKRFGNDPELVADFQKLKACAADQEGRLDYACPAIKTLRLRLEVKGRRENRPKLIKTLLNLLESRSAHTRLLAAESLYSLRREATVGSSLARALGQERVPAVKAAMLRQLCWAREASAAGAALKLLAASNPELVRAQAAVCLGQQEELPVEAIKALKGALRGDPSARVRGDACAAVGRHWNASGVPLMASLLSRDDVGWRCAAGLAEVGTRESYQALQEGINAALQQGRLPAQFVRALGAFSAKPFFNRPDVIKLLRRVAARPLLGEPALSAARDELRRLEE